MSASTPEGPLRRDGMSYRRWIHGRSGRIGAWATAVVVGLWLSSCSVEQTEEGEMPAPARVEEGQLPEYDVDASDVEVESEAEEIVIPTGGAPPPAPMDEGGYGGGTSGDGGDGGDHDEGDEGSEKTEPPDENLTNGGER